VSSVRRPPGARSAARVSLIAPIKKTRVAEEIAERIRVLILDGTFPPDSRCPLSARSPSGSA
jgi:hypothetical protein